MSTRLYFQSTGVVDFSRGEGDANLAGTTVNWRPSPVATTRGSSSIGSTATSIAGPTSGVEPTSGFGKLEYLTEPLDQDITISGSVIANLWGLESSMNANAALGVIIERLNSQGARASTIFQAIASAELNTAAGVQNFSGTPTSTNMLKGDRLRIRVYFDDAPATTMASGFTLTFDCGGPTAAADGDSYIEFTETFGFLTTAPSGSTLYLTDTASDIDPNGASYDAKEAWTSRGGGVQTVSTNDATGPTTPLLATASLGGNFLEWFTKGLSAFTLSGLVACNIRALETSASSNATVRVEIAICASDGTSPTIWGAATDGAELGTSEAAMTFFVAGDDTAITDGQRLRIRVYFDDAAQFAMANAGDLTLYYAGTSAGASGDTYIKLPQTVTEYVTGSVTVSVTAGAASWTGRSVGITFTQAVTAGSAAWTGQAVTVSIATVVPVTAGTATWTGQSVLATQTVAVGAASATWTGQSVTISIASVIGVTAGSASWTGQSVSSSITVPVTTGSASWTGQTVTPTRSIPVTPGAATWTGQSVALVIPTVVPITAGAVTWTGVGVTVTSSGNITVGISAGTMVWTGQTVGVTFSNVVTAGQASWQGQTVTPTRIVPVVAGQATWQGQAVTVSTPVTVPITAGSVTWTGVGVTVNTGANVTVGVSAGSITWTGQSVTVNAGANVTVGVTAAAVTWQGQTVTISTTSNVVVSVTSGTTTWTGQAVGVKINLVVAAASIAWQGQTVGLVRVTSITAGQATWTGQSVGLRYGYGITPGAVLWEGQLLDIQGIGYGTPVKGPTRKRLLAGTQAATVLVTSARAVPSVQETDADVLVGAPAAVRIGAASNSLEDV